MVSRLVQYHKVSHVMTISITRPQDDLPSVCRLAQELQELGVAISGDQDIYSIILTGTGDNFLKFRVDPKELAAWVREGHSLPSLAEPIAKIERPVIAAIPGQAFGQGLEVALACDIRIAHDTCVFGFPQIGSEMIPWDGGTQRLTRLVGKGKALELILLGEKIDAREALRIGLVNQLVPFGELMTTAMEMAQGIAAKAPIASRFAKEAVYKGMDLTLEQGLRLEADLYFLIHTTQDRTEGIKAFQEKRKANFEGR
jgi:enoyl-CoA hydratase/carnithine racemase